MFHPFWRAAALTLAWVLVGLGFDPGPDASSVPVRPAQGATQSARVPGAFAERSPAATLAKPVPAR